MKNKNKIIFRADGNKTIGFGHIYRIMALVQMLKDIFDCKVAVADPDDFIKILVSNTGIELIPLPAISYKLPNDKQHREEIPFDLNNVLTGNEVVVTDGYWFGEKYQSSIKKFGCKLFCIDDLAQHHFVADGVINHALGIKKEQYDLAPETKLLTGYDYLLLRPEFFRPVTHQYNAEKKRVLITMGGSDVFDLNYFFTDLILGLQPDVILDVILPTSIDESTLSKFKEKQSVSKNLNLYFRLGAPEIVDLIDRVTHAIVSASTVLLEVNARGLKPLTGFYTVNQKGIYYGAIKAGMAEGLENLLEIDVLETKIKISEYLSGNAILNKIPDGRGIINRYKELFSNVEDPSIV